MFVSRTKLALATAEFFVITTVLSPPLARTFRTTGIVPLFNHANHRTSAMHSKGKYSNEQIKSAMLSNLGAFDSTSSLILFVRIQLTSGRFCAYFWIVKSSECCKHRYFFNWFLKTTLDCVLDLACLVAMDDIAKYWKRTACSRAISELYLRCLTTDSDDGRREHRRTELNVPVT